MVFHFFLFAVGIVVGVGIGLAFNNNITTYKDPIQTTGTVVQVCALLGGGLWGFYQWGAQQQQDRVDKNIRFVELFFSEQITNARETINSTWVKEMDDLSGKLVEIKNLAEQRQAFEQETLTKINSTGIGTEINLVLSFYESLLVCIASEVCDGKTAKEFFGAEAKWFFIWHRSYIRTKFTGSKFEHSNIQWLRVAPLAKPITKT